MTRTYRRRDLKEPVRDGKCWRGCDGMYCSWCSETRQNKKLKDRMMFKID
jgi:hypothetical protein